MTELSRIINIPPSASQALARVQWEIIEADTDSIWMKSKVINPEQARILELVFIKLLPDQWCLGNSGVFYDRSQLSVTVMMRNVLDPYWDHIGPEKSEIQYYAENLDRLFAKY